MNMEKVWGKLESAETQTFGFMQKASQEKRQWSQREREREKEIEENQRRKIKFLQDTAVYRKYTA